MILQKLKAYEKSSGNKVGEQIWHKGHTLKMVEKTDEIKGVFQIIVSIVEITYLKFIQNPRSSSDFKHSPYSKGT